MTVGASQKLGKFVAIKRENNRIFSKIHVNWRRDTSRGTLAKE